MATSNNNCNALAQETPVCKFHKKIKGEHKQYENQLNIFGINIKSLETECDYALSNLEQTKKTFNFYQDLNNFQLFDMVKSAEIIKADIDDQAKKDTDELGKMIAEASKSLNELQVKLHEANNVACSMRNCLQGVLGFKDEGEPSEPDQLKCVTRLAKKLNKNGKDAANAMINVAGIHTFSNLETLKPTANNLIEKLTILKGQTDTLVGSAQEGKDDAQVKLTEVLEKLNEEQFRYFQTTSKVNAHEATLSFICGTECCSSIDEVGRICDSLSNRDTELEKPPLIEKPACTEEDED